MVMKAKDGFAKIKTHKGTSLFYFFCEKAGNGKPGMFFDTKKVSEKDPLVVELMSTAKSTNKAHGEMLLDDKDVLQVTPLGSSSVSESALKSGIIKAAADNGATPKGGVVIGAAKAETNKKWTLDKEELKRLKEYKLQNTHPDAFQVLKDDPEMKAWTAEREEKMEKLAALTAQKEPSQDFIEKTVKDIELLDKKMETKAQVFIKQGLAPKEMGKEYAKEDERFGWRLGGAEEMPERNPEESDKDYAARVSSYRKTRASDLMTTKRFNESQKEESKLTIDEDGKFTGTRDFNPDGTSTGPRQLKSGKVDYVIDPQNKQMHQFGAKVETTGKTTAPYTGENPVTKQPMVEGQETDKGVATHHTSVLGERPVAGAGEITFDKGNIVRINNSSGHFKPGAPQMMQTIEILVEAGALVDHTWVMTDGRPLEGKAKEVFEAAQKVQAQLVPKLQKGENVDGDLKLIDKAKQTLIKLGVASKAEKYVKKDKAVDKVVEFIDAGDDRGGRAFKDALDEAQKNPMTPHEFLSSGGGNKEQLGNKQAMQDELKKKYAEKVKNDPAVAKTEKEAEDRSKAYETAELKLAALEHQLWNWPIDKPEEDKKKLEVELKQVKAIVKSRKLIAEGMLERMLLALNKRFEEIVGGGTAVPIPPFPGEMEYVDHPDTGNMVYLKDLAKEWSMAPKDAWKTLHARKQPKAPEIPPFPGEMEYVDHPDTGNMVYLKDLAKEWSMAPKEAWKTLNLRKKT